VLAQQRRRELVERRRGVQAAGIGQAAREFDGGVLDFDDGAAGQGLRIGERLGIPGRGQF